MIMKDRMHIAFFTNTYYPLVSGVVRSVSVFRQSLSDLCHNVFVFAQDASGYRDEEPFIFRYPAFKLGFPGDFPASIPFSPFIDSLFPDLKVNVIHSHHPILLGQAAANKAEKHKLPLVFTYHSRYQEYSHYVSLNQEFFEEFVKDAIHGWLGRYMRRCQHIIVPGESIRQKLWEEYGMVTPITVVPTGIDLVPYQSADGGKIRQKLGWGDRRVLISVGRLAKEKNWELLLEAAARVMQTHPDVLLVIIGEGDEREDLEEYAHELGISDRVELPGKVDFDDIPSYLKAANLFCFASLTETQGLVTMEAMSAGLPVVAVDGTGTRDALEHGKEGFLTEPDPDSLAQAIIQVLDDQELRARFRQAVERKARFFAIEEQAKKLLEVYQEAIEAKKSNQFVRVEQASNEVTAT
jgi:1,2-diacylglycerol 3-alpha-glucosyltransferase